MGKYNSSEYRIKPLMKQIENNSQNFERFIDLLGINTLSKPIEYRYADNESGNTEKALKPTKAHLLGLIKYLYIGRKSVGSFSVSGDNRIGLLNGEPEKYYLAKSEILKNYSSLPPKAWYVFEGHTYPDIFIEGEDYIIICEGKWTEPHITTETSFLKAENGAYRNQMVRHIQGALNYNENKEVYAFYIVDENCSYIDDLTLGAFAEQVEKETISLGYNEKIDVISSYCGVITWQDIERVIAVKFMTKDEIDAIK